ncbi:MAG: hypothetical protein ACP5OC_07015 [Thermoplasmata archaeon]
MHNNFEKLAKLDDETIARYRAVLEKVFEERFIGEGMKLGNGSN